MPPGLSIAVLAAVCATLVYAWGNLIGVSMAVGAILGWWSMPWSLDPVMTILFFVLLMLLLDNVLQRLL